MKAPFEVGARVNRTLVLFTPEYIIKRAGFQYGKSGKKEAFFCRKRQSRVKEAEVSVKELAKAIPAHAIAKENNIL